MNEYSITAPIGQPVRLLTAGKYCDRNIVVTAGGAFPGLPEGYAKCDYIRFTGEQTVDTGLLCTQETKLRVVFTRESTASRYLFGVVNSGNTASVTAYLGGTWRFGNKSVSKGSAVTADAEIVYTGILDKTQIMLTNSETAISDVNDFVTVGSITIGSCRASDGDLGSPQFEGKMLQFELWEGEEQMLNLVPVVSFDGVYRFWDRVSESFFDSVTDVPLQGGNF